MNKASYLIRRVIRGPIPCPSDYCCNWNDMKPIERLQVSGNASAEAERILNALTAWGNDQEHAYPPCRAIGLCAMTSDDYLLALLKWFAPLFHGLYYFPPIRWNRSTKPMTVFNVKESIVPRIKLMNEIINYLKFGI